MTTLPVPLGNRSYQVHVGTFDAEQACRLLTDALGAPTGVALLTDGRLLERSARAQTLVALLQQRLRNAAVLALPAGEACKTMSAVEASCQWMAEQGLDRGAAVVGIGGGATSDHAGFAAAIYLRGIPFATYSTTLLGMVDAAVGGKTGADLPAGKNLVGAFHQPRVVLADLGCFETLPRREIAAGLAEVVKAGLIATPAILDRIERHLVDGTLYEPAALDELVTMSIRMKIDVVTSDEREAGRRAILNFGHTLGHAIESAAGYELLHGEAVSLGMIAALALGEIRGHTPRQLRPRVRAALEHLGLPVDVAPWLRPDVLARMDVDKKRRSDRVKFVFVRQPGDCLLEDVRLDDLKRDVVAALV
jgi:3-dehydroquinate synthase